MRDRFTEPQVVLDPDTFSGGEIRSLAFSPDGRHLAVAGDVVRIYDIDQEDSGPDVARAARVRRDGAVAPALHTRRTAAIWWSA
jgi:WD40 repeat protein